MVLSLFQLTFGSVLKSLLEKETNTQEGMSGSFTEYL